MKKYKNKHRIESIRAPWWDYSQPGLYFITICTKDKISYFGDLQYGRMEWTPVGVAAHLLWKEIPFHHQHVSLDEFIVMPNHLHGILRLDEHVISNPIKKELKPGKNEYFSKISPKPGSVTAIVRSYKSAVTHFANQMGLAHAWQSRFHDHIIRNQESYHRIKNYIIQNPAHWESDCFYFRPPVET